MSSHDLREERDANAARGQPLTQAISEGAAEAGAGGGAEAGDSALEQWREAAWEYLLEAGPVQNLSSVPQRFELCPQAGRSREEPAVLMLDRVVVV